MCDWFRIFGLAKRNVCPIPQTGKKAFLCSTKTCSTMRHCRYVRILLTVIFSQSTILRYLTVSDNSVTTVRNYVVQEGEERVPYREHCRSPIDCVSTPEVRDGYKCLKNGSAAQSANENSGYSVLKREIGSMHVASALETSRCMSQNCQ